MAIIRYTLDSGSVPSYISDGGHFMNPADNTLIGIGSGGGTTIASKSDLITYVLSIHANYPLQKHSGNPSCSDCMHDVDPSVTSHAPITTINQNMTDSEVTALVNSWCTERSIS
tara:strand:- start:161 stop:502 length:342 start_codon:yes stop_codon:yes gene_type:complete